ncbi:uncharacterized protein TNCV_1532791 [Trichonephila clavipes]|nr:uncharacterized protein TNCV_1532791 [Trichonephila clavipes]
MGNNIQRIKMHALHSACWKTTTSGECMLAEVALNCTAIQIRRLFAIVLTTCFPARAQILWEIHKDSMTDDILHQHRIRCHDPTITFSDEMYNEALIAIEDLCIVIANFTT